MRQKFRFITLFLLAGLPLISWAQNDSIMKFTLRQAQEYAINNNAKVQNALRDIEITKKQVWETLAIGMPHADSKFSYSYMLNLPSTLEELVQFFSIGQNFTDIYSMLALLAQEKNSNVLMKLDSMQKGLMPKPNINLNDFRWNMTLDFTVSQLIFSGPYLVGVQTMKVFKSLTDLAYTKSKSDVAEDISNAYFLVLIARESKSLLDSMYVNIKNTGEQTETIGKQGFMDETDVDQIKLTVNTVKNACDLINRQVDLADQLLKFQMGIDINKKIELSDDLNSLIEKDLLSLIADDFVLEKNTDYQLLQKSVKLQELNVKYRESNYLPTAVAFYSHEENFNKNSFTFTPPNLIGASVSLPLFSSGQRMAQVSEAKIGLEKAKTNMQMASQGLLLEYSQNRSDYLNALDKVNQEKDNMNLSKKIYERTLIKYQQGMSSSMDLTQAQNQYIQKESDYYKALIQLITSKSKLENLLSKNNN